MIENNDVKKEVAKLFAERDQKFIKEKVNESRFLLDSQGKKIDNMRGELGHQLSKVQEELEEFPQMMRDALNQAIQDKKFPEVQVSLQKLEDVIQNFKYKIDQLELRDKSSGKWLVVAIILFFIVGGITGSMLTEVKTNRSHPEYTESFTPSIPATPPAWLEKEADEAIAKQYKKHSKK